MYAGRLYDRDALFRKDHKVTCRCADICSSLLEVAIAASAGIALSRSARILMSKIDSLDARPARINQGEPERDIEIQNHSYGSST
jgi:hypothetical protein